MTQAYGRVAGDHLTPPAGYSAPDVVTFRVNDFSNSACCSTSSHCFRA
jgi:hypothetical protein